MTFANNLLRLIWVSKDYIATFAMHVVSANKHWKVAKADR